VSYCVRRIDNLSINGEGSGTILENRSMKSCNGKNSVVKCQVPGRSGFAPLTVLYADARVGVVHSPAGGMYGAKSGASSPVL